MTRWSRALAAALLLGASAAAAQPAPDALRAEQARLFAEMVARPGDLDAMFAYAAVSMRLQDYEAAIATLERMLIFEPDLPRVRLELGVAYFRLGSYEVARTYFEDALAADPPEAVVARVRPFLDQIERRTARNAVSGFVSVGPVYSSNANLGPSDREFAAGGGTFVLPESADAEGDVGLRVSAGLRHEYDLRLAREGAWISSAVYSGLRYAEVEGGEFDAVQLETGPRLSLDEEAFGLTARPFALGGFVRSENAPLYGFGGLGFELTDSFDADTAAFGVVSAQWRDYEEGRDAYDGLYLQGRAGVAWTRFEDLTLRATLLLESDRAEEGYAAANEIGLRLSVARDFPTAALTGLETVFAGAATTSAFVQGSARRFDDPDPVIDPDTRRRDVELRMGVRLFQPLAQGWGVSADAGLLERWSNFSQYEVESLEIGLSVLKTF